MTSLKKGQVICMVMVAGEDISVRWSQNWGNRDKVYTMMPFYLEDDHSYKSLIFVNKKMVDELKCKSTYEVPDKVVVYSNQIYKTKITDEFQHGSLSDRQFLVYHDKDDTPYQIRFFERRKDDHPLYGKKISKWLNVSATFASAWGGTYLKSF